MNDTTMIPARAQTRPIFAAAAAVTRAAALRRPLADELSARGIIPNTVAGEVAEMVLRGPQPPASTSDPAWASELQRQVWVDALDLMAPLSVLASLPLNRVSFNGAARVTVPARKPDASPNLAATWRAPGDPMRVGGLSLTEKDLTPFSLGVVGTYSMELLERSNVDQMIERAMRRDTAIALDRAFLDAQSATAKRPAGLQTYATAHPASGTTVDAITSDLKACATAMVDAGCGTQPVWIMSILVLQALMTLRDATGALAFPTLSGSPPTLLTFPITHSTTAPRDAVFLVDADELAVGGNPPTVEASEVGVLHEDDTAPLPIGTAGTPATVAAPTREIWQTNAGATRMLWDTDWTVLAEGAVQTITGTDAWLQP